MYCLEVQKVKRWAEHAHEAGRAGVGRGQDRIFYEKIDVNTLPEP